MKRANAVLAETERSWGELALTGALTSSTAEKRSRHGVSPYRLGMPYPTTIARPARGIHCRSFNDNRSKIA
jgi:hypothetical protein